MYMSCNTAAAEPRSTFHNEHGSADPGDGNITDTQSDKENEEDIILLRTVWATCYTVPCFM